MDSLLWVCPQECFASYTSNKGERVLRNDDHAAARFRLGSQFLVGGRVGSRSLFSRHCGCWGSSSSSSPSSSSPGIQIWRTQNGSRQVVSIRAGPQMAHRSKRHTGRHEGPGHSKDDAVQRKMKVFHEGRDGPPLRILPIGGLGEIGMNCMLVGNYDRYIMIDAGLMFPDYDDLGIQKVLPDTGFIRRWRDKIEAVIITHGHEDHIGALPWVVPALDPKTPIYATGFTMQLIKKRLKEFNIPSEGRLRTFSMRSRFNAGPFELEPIRVTHSIPDCCGLVMRCADGIIFHTGDWKIDESPVDGNVFDRTALEQLQKEGVTLMMSDSTNVLSPGRTKSEADVAEAMMRKIMAAKGRRVITTQFASNVHRLGCLNAAAEVSGRKLVFIGLSLRTYLEAAWRDGQAPFDPSILVKAEDMDAYAPKDLLVVTTGSQAEPRAALNLASLGTSRLLKLQKEDVVLYSAKMIPGNETRVVKMMNRIAELGPTITMGRGDNLHTSGHAYRGELEEVLRLVKPQHFLPVHGEFAFLKEHELLGKASGIRHTAVIKNGEMLGVAPLRNGRVLSSGFSLLGREKMKLMYNDGDRAFGTATDLCLQERMKIALEGIVIASVEVMRGDESPMSKDEDEEELQEEQDEADEYGLQARVRITTRCLWTDNGKLLEALQKAADLALMSCPKGARLSMVERHLGAVLRKVVQKYSNRRPEVIVIATDSSEAVGVNNRTPQRHQTPRDIWSGFSIDSKVGSIEGPAPRVQVRPAVETIPSSVESASPSVVREIPAVDPIEDGVQFVTAPAVEAISAVKNVAVKAISAVESVVSNDDGVDAASLHPSPKSVVVKNIKETMLESDELPTSGAPPTPTTREEAEEASMTGKNQEEAPSSPKRRQKWRLDETHKLIEVRSAMATQLRKDGSKKKPTWKDVAVTLAGLGFNRSPEQCSSMWSSLVKKYEAVVEERKAGALKEWTYFEAMKAALSKQGKSKSSKSPVAASTR